MYDSHKMALEARIASPCSANWNQMAGDDRVRFCPECQRNVYNFSSMTESEVKRLVAQSEGRLCARFYQRLDGTMLAKNCPVGFRGSIFRATRMATATLAALMSAAPSFAKPAAGPEQIVPPVLLQIEAAHPVISIVVFDPAGAVIPNAEITFRNTKTGETLDAKTDSEGALNVAGLSKGKYKVTVRATGFRTEMIDRVDVPSSKPLKVRLEVGTVMMGEVVALGALVPTPEAAPLDSHLTAPPDQVVPSNVVAQPSKFRRFFSRILQSL